MKKVKKCKKSSMQGDSQEKDSCQNKAVFQIRTDHKRQLNSIHPDSPQQGEHDTRVIRWIKPEQGEKPPLIKPSSRCRTGGQGKKTTSSKFRQNHTKNNARDGRDSFHDGVIKSKYSKRSQSEGSRPSVANKPKAIRCLLQGKNKEPIEIVAKMLPACRVLETASSNGESITSSEDVHMKGEKEGRTRPVLKKRRGKAYQCNLEISRAHHAVQCKSDEDAAFHLAHHAASSVETPAYLTCTLINGRDLSDEDETEYHQSHPEITRLDTPSSSLSSQSPQQSPSAPVYVPEMLTNEPLTYSYPILCDMHEMYGCDDQTHGMTNDQTHSMPQPEQVNQYWPPVFSSNYYLEVCPQCKNSQLTHGRNQPCQKPPSYESSQQYDQDNLAWCAAGNTCNSSVTGKAVFDPPASCYNGNSAVCHCFYCMNQNNRNPPKLSPFAAKRDPMCNSDSCKTSEECLWETCSKPRRSSACKCPVCKSECSDNPTCTPRECMENTICTSRKKRSDVRAYCKDSPDRSCIKNKSEKVPFYVSKQPIPAPLPPLGGPSPYRMGPPHCKPRPGCRPPPCGDYGPPPPMCEPERVNHHLTSYMCHPDDQDISSFPFNALRWFFTFLAYLLIFHAVMVFFPLNQFTHVSVVMIIILELFVLTFQPDNWILYLLVK